MFKNLKEKLILELYLTKGVGNLTLQKILEKIKEEEISQMTPLELGKLGEVSDLAGFIAHYTYVKAHPEWLENLRDTPFITYQSPHYPSCLKEMYRCPSVLFYKGDLSLLQKKSLAIVGSRKEIPEGKQVMAKFLPSLLPKFVIVSGLAKGCDTLAHLETLRYGGKTIAVLGNGLNVCYPKENATLQNEIAKRGLLLTEYLPHSGPKRHHFPLRNRIIAGLTQGTWVLAAKKRSGSLITAHLALDNNREVFALPGSPLDDAFSGCLELIQAGAKCVKEPADILNEFYFTKDY